MTKAKRLLSILAAAIMCLGMFMFASCNDKATAYTIYVKDANGAAMANVMIGICEYDEATGEKAACLAPVTTDAEGKAVIEATEKTYTINDDVLGNYSCQQKYVFKAYGEYTVVLVVNG